MIIQTQDELNAFCQKLAQGPYLTIDTEFLRDKTYYPILCLIQMAGPDVDAAAIDPIEHKHLDLAPFHALMANKKVLKVFHAARQDLEIFYQLSGGALPTPIFDTQVAAMVTGFGDQVAYNALVQQLTGHALEKGAQFTDWSRRPLSGKQIKYALDDVIFLREVYEKLAALLKKENRESWADQEMAVLTSTKTYAFDPEDAWERVKIRSDKPEVLAILKALAGWREAEAQRRDVPRGHVLKDETLADLALYRPKDEEGLSRVRSLQKSMVKGEKAQKILKLIAGARAADPKTWPTPPAPVVMPRDARPVLEMLKMLLRICAAEADVTPRLVASNEDLEHLAAEDKPDIHTLEGWRYEVFGKEAIALKSGKMALSIKNGKIIRQPL